MGKVIICGTGCKEKTCITCENFFLWGVSTGRCNVKNDDMLGGETCEFHKYDPNWEAQLEE